MDVNGIITTIKQWRWVLALVVLVAAAGGYWVSTQMPTTYESRVRMLVGPINTDIDTLRASGQLTATYAELATSQALMDATIRQLKLPYTRDELAERIHPTADTATRLLIVRAVGENPRLTAAIANSLGRRLARLAAEGDPRPDGQLLIVDAAERGVPVGAGPVLIVLISVLAGLIAALNAILLREYLRYTVRSEDQLAGVGGLAYLGRIQAPPRRWLPGRRARPALRPASSARGADYRLLATKIALTSREAPITSLLVVGVRNSSWTGEITANLGAVLGTEYGRQVAVIDANPEAAEVTAIAQMNGRSGLSDITRAGVPSLSWVELGHTLEPWLSEVSVVPVGTGDSNADELAAPTLVPRLRELCDVMVVNSAPVLLSPAAMAWARAVDATLIVVHRDYTAWDDLVTALDSLRLVGAQVVGVVFEEARPRRVGRRPSRTVAPTAGRVPAATGATGEAAVDAPDAMAAAAPSRQTGPTS